MPAKKVTMATAKQITKWRRKAETAHRKLVEIAEEVGKIEGEASDLYSYAASAHIEAAQLAYNLEK